jgi:sortase (surface protein transpeptidase)
VVESSSGRDADLRARMRSQVRGREYQTERRLYSRPPERIDIIASQDVKAPIAKPVQSAVLQPQPAILLEPAPAMIKKAMPVIAVHPAPTADEKPAPLPIVFPSPERANPYVRSMLEPQQAVANPTRQGLGYEQEVTRDETMQQTPVSAQLIATKPRRLFRFQFHFLQNRLLTGMAAAVFVIGVVAAVNGMLTNRHISAQVQAMSSQSETGDDSPAPSTDKPSDQAIQNYAVAPYAPRYISIDNLNVFARIMAMGVNAKNRLQAPGNVYDAGWYTGSSAPGAAGATLIDGHISSWTTKGVFYGINKLKSGDPIVITRGDGKKLTYVVRSVSVSDEDKVNMASLLVSTDPGKPGLNLISCFGDVMPGTNEFDKRVIVYAVQQ